MQRSISQARLDTSIQLQQASVLSDPLRAAYGKAAESRSGGKWVVEANSTFGLSKDEANLIYWHRFAFFNIMLIQLPI
jgi:hypothetical protein